jgi:hypothetical protein
MSDADVRVDSARAAGYNYALGFKGSKGSGLKEGLQSFNPYMKLNGTIPNKKIIIKNTLLGIEVFRNLKSQAPNSKKIPYFNIQ